MKFDPEIKSKNLFALADFELRRIGAICNELDYSILRRNLYLNVAVNPIDILLVIVILLSVLNGYRRGFIHGVLDLAGWVLSLIAGLRYYQPVAQWLGPRFDLWSEVWDQPIAFVLVAVLVGMAVQIVGYLLLRRLPENVHDGRINQLFGVIPGFANGFIVVAILSALLLAIPLSEGLSERTRDSALVNVFRQTPQGPVTNRVDQHSNEYGYEHKSNRLVPNFRPQIKTWSKPTRDRLVIAQPREQTQHPTSEVEHAMHESTPVSIEHAQQNDDHEQDIDRVDCHTD